MLRHHHHILPRGVGLLEHAVDQARHVVARLLHGLVERREVGLREAADRLVVVDPHHGDVVGYAQPFTPPLGLVARLGDVVGVVVVAGHDRHGLGQRLEPRGELRRVVVPEVVARAVEQLGEGVGGVGRADGVAEADAPLVDPLDVVRAVEGEVAEAFLEEVVGADPPCGGVGRRDVGYGGEAAFEVLGYGDDAVAAEELHVVGVVELADHGVGLHAYGPLHDGFDAEFVAYRERQADEAPALLLFLGVAGDARQKPSCVGFGEVGEEDDACHGGVGECLLRVKDTLFFSSAKSAAAFPSSPCFTGLRPSGGRSVRDLAGHVALSCVPD